MTLLLKDNGGWGGGGKQYFRKCVLQNFRPISHLTSHEVLHLPPFIPMIGNQKISEYKENN